MRERTGDRDDETEYCNHAALRDKRRYWPDVFISNKNHLLYPFKLKNGQYLFALWQKRP